MTVKDKVIVVGGGPVGALAALYTARRGYEVEVYEFRDDPNAPSASEGKLALIPVTISERGFRAVENANVPGLMEDISRHSLPVHSRMVHTRDKNGDLKETSMPYSSNGDRIHIMQRTSIGQRILLALSKEPNAKVFFDHKLVTCDLRNKTATFENVKWKPQDGGLMESTENMKVTEQTSKDAERTKSVTYDYIIGADGAHSAIRKQLMRETNVDYEQHYVDVLWCDFYLPPGPKGQRKLDEAHLHVWPDKERVFIVLPEVDGSARGGMVAPINEFRRLKEHPEELEVFFDSSYPGVIPDLMSAESVKEQFFRRDHLSLMSIKCGKIGWEDSCVLLGDSSHTMPPFYGMGMNTGLEDVRVFFEDFVDPAHRENVYSSINTFCPKGVTKAYTDYRIPDVQAMTDIASDHFEELKEGVPGPAVIARKRVESELQKHVPGLDYVPMYSRIVFGHERFSVALKKDAQQKILFAGILASLCALCVAMLVRAGAGVM
ncbi:MAG: hypothetical protein L6R36_007716 [Xanthoria steineri]|nr:MAG: hypothetical protein L6R36_007716 [Xanthoria steineri]